MSAVMSHPNSPSGSLIAARPLPVARAREQKGSSETRMRAKRPRPADSEPRLQAAVARKDTNQPDPYADPPCTD